MSERKREGTIEEKREKERGVARWGETEKERKGDRQGKKGLRQKDKKERERVERDKEERKKR